MKRITAVNRFEPGFDQKWFLIASRSSAAIYSEGKDHRFRIIQQLDNPQGRLTEGALDSDRPGRCASKASSTVHHSLDRHFKKHEQTAILFIKKIIVSLSFAAQNNWFEELTLVAEPHLLGLIRGNLPATLLQKKIRFLTREYTQGTPKEIRQKVYSALALP